MGGNDSAAWDSAPWMSGFLVYSDGRAKNYAVEKPTAFKAGWTGDRLRILVKCYDSKPDSLKSDSLWDNGVELFFYPRSEDNYFQLVTNIAGRRWSGIGQIRETEVKWDVKTSVTENAWLAEIQIPFKSSEKAPVTGEKWPVNIGRNSVSSGERFTSWSPVGGDGFHDVKHFGKFIFLGPGTPESARREESGLNSQYRKFLSERISETGAEYANAQKLMSVGMKYHNLQKELLPLTEGWREVALLFAESAPSFETMRLFLMRRGNLKQATEEIKHKIQLEELLSKHSEQVSP
jgi:hypothetical protein